MHENPAVLNNNAILLSKAGKFDEAVACFKRALLMDNNNSLFWYNLGMTYRDAGRTEDAINALETSFKINPNHMDVILSLATILFQEENYLESLMYCSLGIDVCHTDSNLWNLLGVNHFALEEYELASMDFENSLMFNPYNADALFNLRDTYDELGNKTGAHECDRRLKEIEK